MEKLEGMISDIVFKNEENGYTIAYLANEDEEVTIVGCMPTLSVGESIEVEGRWVTHKTYGSQFEVNKFMPVTPSSLEGIYASCSKLRSFHDVFRQPWFTPEIVYGLQYKMYAR